ncbi:MAG: hypothetical protein JWL73_2287 [Actinomycetia bacterium]|nr:hypothetical protein [Actinomycetes bacterium]
MASDASTALAEVFARVARGLLAADDLQSTLQQITELAVETVAGCDAASITIVKGRQLTTQASTDDLALDVDAIQYETGEGPCLDAIRERQVFRTGDLGTEVRWPHFATRAKEVGAVSMMSFRLFVEQDTLGALNLLSRHEAAFDDDALAVGAVFASHAAIAMSTARHDADMDIALQSRDLIGQAKGILMASEHVSAEGAFDMLRTSSQNLNRKLLTIAAEVTQTGALPKA